MKGGVSGVFGVHEIFLVVSECEKRVQRCGLTYARGGGGRTNLLPLCAAAGDEGIELCQILHSRRRCKYVRKDVRLGVDVVQPILYQVSWTDCAGSQQLFVCNTVVLGSFGDEL